MEAIGYVRVSTEEQARDGISVEAQQARIEAWCKAHDADLVRVYSDNGISGKRMKNRRGLQAALKDVCARRGVLVCYSISRVARSTRDTLEIADQLGRCHAELASISENINTTTASGKMVFRLLAVLAEFERDQVSERVSMALAHKRTKGERYTNVAPYGYCWKRDRLTRQSEEQLVIRRIGRLRAQGMGYKRIADRLNDAGVQTRSGGRWFPTSVKNVVKRRASSRR